MNTKLDIEQWDRKDHFLFFRQFEEPFFGICVNIDCTIAYDTAKKNGISFFLYYLYQSLRAANEITPFRYRIAGEEVIVYDVIHASPTINRPDGTFGFSYIDYDPSFDSFLAKAKSEMERVQNSKGLVPAISGENVIHYSSLPWLHFTSVSHARSFSFKDSCPKITFGKWLQHDQKKMMPLSVHVHHALMDGLHVAQFVDLFQSLMNQPLTFFLFCLTGLMTVFV